VLKFAMKSPVLNGAARSTAVMANVWLTGASMKSHEACKYCNASERHDASADSNERPAVFAARALDSNAKTDANDIE